ncbi:MAG: ABC transporter ATP-binding protein [Polyangia bacterium]|nr:ABC transporter ATP-binding protein [Polyangia bacterium]
MTQPSEAHDRCEGSESSEGLILRARGLVHRYGRAAKAVDALHGVDLSVRKGEIFGLLGPNGAGKTTTIRILTAQLAPTAGEAMVAGCDVVRDRRELHRRIGVVFDTPNLYDALTGRQNLVFFADLYGAPLGRIAALLERVRLTEAADRPFKGYSKGMKQRLGLARALLVEPQVLFLDEPTSGLDPASAHDVRALIREVADRGITVFLTTHLMELADQVCDRMAILYSGSVKALGSPRALKMAHGAPELVVRFEGGEVARLPLGGAETPSRVAALLERGGVQTIATEEPTLEEVFLSLTGSALR